MIILKNNFKYSLFDFLKGLFYLFFKKSIPINDKNIFYLNHARTGILLALQSLELPKHSKVGVMMFNCHTVPNAVALSGNDIVFIDIDKEFQIDFEDLRKKANKLSVIIITHLFGIYSDIDKVREVCPNIPLIEDCAHSFLTKDYYNQLVGYKGDFSCFSIGLGKFPSIGGGGILCVNNSKYVNNIKNEYAMLCEPSFKDEILVMMRNYYKSLLNSRFFHLYFDKIIKQPDRHKKIKQYPINKIYKSMYYSYVSEQNKYEMYVEKQRIIISKILEILMPKKSIYVPHIDVNRSNCIMLPIMVENREKLLLFFKDHYFFTSPQYSEAIEWMSAFGYLRGSCPKSEIIIEQNVIIPTHYKMSEKEINDLCKILQNIL